MIALDVNVLVPALWAEATAHNDVAPWLQATLSSREQVGVSDAVLTSVVRILSHPRIFTRPATTDQAVTAVETFVEASGVVVLPPGPGYLEIFARLCRESGARGNLVSDAGHAATAHHATFVTFDRDFARFPGLRWRLPG